MKIEECRETVRTRGPGEDHCQAMSSGHDVAAALGNPTAAGAIYRGPAQAKLVNIPAWSRGSQGPTPSRGAVGSRWLLKDRESVFLRSVSLVGGAHSST